MRHERLPIGNLTLDTTNPRVARIFDMYGGHITEERMKLALGVSGTDDENVGTTFMSLKESIKTNKGIIHPIIVNETDTGQLIVIEGNTRTMIYRDLAEQGVDGDWNTIPAMIHTQLSQGEIDAIRLQAHLVGPRPWDAYSKGKYLHYLRNSEHLTFNQIVDFYGGNRQEVNRYIEAYNDMEGYYRPILDSDADFDQTKFSSFVELQRDSITNALIDAGYTKNDYARWVSEGKLVPQLLIRSLPRVLRNPRAKAVFLQDGIQQAAKLLDVPQTSELMKEATLGQLLTEVKRRVWDMSYGEVMRLKAAIGTEENDAIVEARDALVQLCTDIASSD